VGHASKNGSCLVGHASKNGSCLVGHASDDARLVGVNSRGYSNVAWFWAIAMSSVVAVRANRVTAAVGWLRVDSDDLSAGISSRDV